MSRVVVVGAGVSGLAAAYALVGRGLEVTVIEASPAVGGKLRVSEVAGVRVDEGAETFLRRQPEALELVESLGRSAELVSPQPRSAAVWSRGALRPLPVRTVLGIPSDPAALRGVLTRGETVRAAFDRLLPGQPPGDDISVGRWVGHRLGRAVVDRLVDPLLGGVYAGRADDLSLAATVPQLPRDERSALAAARRALPEPSASAGPVFATLTAGMGSLATSLGDAIRAGGGTILTGRAVRRLERDTTGWRVVHGPTTDEQALSTDAVIVAVPASPASRLLGGPVPAAAHELASVEAASMAIVTTAWPAAAVPPAAISGYLVPAVYGRPIKAVTFSSSKWAHLASSKTVIVRCSIGRYGDVTDLQRDDSDLVAAAVAELTSYAGFRGQPLDSRVTRWGGGLPQYTVGHRDRVARIRSAVGAAPGLAVCGATYEGVGVPACIRTGQAAAEQVTEFLATIRPRQRK